MRVSGWESMEINGMKRVGISGEEWVEVSGGLSLGLVAKVSGWEWIR